MSENRADSSARRSMYKNLGVVLGISGLPFTAFLSLRAPPALSTIHWLPKALTHWADAHPRLDNFPAYALVGMPFYFFVSHGRHVLMVSGGLIVFIGLLELAQRGMPTRRCDPWDVFWGGLGVVSGGFLVRLLRIGWGCYCRPKQTHVR